jgi:hypothetical protein
MLHHSQLLTLLCRQPSHKYTPPDFKRKIDMDRPAADPEIHMFLITEEIDYLLMARLIAGDDLFGYQLTDYWRHLPAEIQAEWICYGSPLRERPELDDPISIYRRWKMPYGWESNNWFSFQFAICQDVGGGEMVVVILSGLNQNKKVFEAQSIRDRVSSALTLWYQTPEGLAAWHEACGDFNVGDLANTYSESLKVLLKSVGLRDFRFITASGDSSWQHDNILGKPPG